MKNKSQPANPRVCHILQKLWDSSGNEELSPRKSYACEDSDIPSGLSFLCDCRDRVLPATDFFFHIGKVCSAWAVGSCVFFVCKKIQERASARAAVSLITS